MKIEKGKLYLYAGALEKCMSDGVVDDGLYSNKIAVYCPTKEDWDYVNKVMGWEWDFSNRFFYRLLGDENYRTGDFDYLEDNGYFRMSMGEFKKFYPETVAETKPDPVNPTHYTSKGIQPIDYIEANGLNFNEGCIIKYLTRYKEKNGLEDLKKAKYYLDRLIEGYEKP